MKLILNSKALLQCLLALKYSINESAVLPQLANVLVVIAGKRMLLTTTDLRQTIIKETDIEAKDGFTFSVDHKALLKIVKNCSEQPLTISLKEKVLTVIGDDFVVNLEAANGNDFPLTTEIAPDTKETIFVSGETKSRLFSYLQQSLPFVSKDDLRPAMTGVHFSSKDNSLSIASTDAHMLYFRDTNIAFAGTELVIPSSSVKAVLDVFKSVDFVKIERQQNRLKVSSDNATMFISLIETKYPNWRMILDSSLVTNKYSFVMVAKDMKRMVKFCNQFSSHCTNQIKMEIDGSIIIYSSGEEGSNAEVRAHIYEATNVAKLTIGFNGNFLLQAINIFKDDYLKISTADSNVRAMIINDCLLIMPLMINDHTY